MLNFSFIILTLFFNFCYFVEYVLFVKCSWRVTEILYIIIITSLRRFLNQKKLNLIHFTWICWQKHWTVHSLQHWWRLGQFAGWFGCAYFAGSLAEHHCHLLQDDLKLKRGVFGFWNMISFSFCVCVNMFFFFSCCNSFSCWF